MKVVSLFSGCGGLDLGITGAGFEMVLASDNDPMCADSHRANFPGVPFFEGPVLDVKGPLLEQTANQPNPVDLLVGGPPCPAFSKSRFYRKEKPRALNDPLAAETLRGYFEVLSILEPRAFVLENVPGLAYRVHREALEYSLGSAAELGYECSWKILNAADYGVPQIRQRFFLVGMRDSAFEFPTPTHAENPVQDLFGRNTEPWKTAGDAIADLDTEENADDTGHFAGGKYNDLLKQVPPGDNYLFFTEKRGHPKPVFRWRSRYWSFLLKLSPDLPSWTIQARRSNNMGPLHWRNRILRLSEVKRLQTFPDDWHLAGTVDQQWRQVGNAVPPKLALRIGRAVHEQLSRDKAGEATPAKRSEARGNRRRQPAAASK